MFEKTNLSLDGVRLELRRASEPPVELGIPSHDDIKWWGLRDRIIKQSAHELGGFRDTDNHHIVEETVIRAALRKGESGKDGVRETIIWLPMTVFTEGWGFEERVEKAMFFDRSGKNVTFAPREPSKGIKYYEGRLTELLAQPGAGVVLNNMFNEQTSSLRKSFGATIAERLEQKRAKR